MNFNNILEVTRGDSLSFRVSLKKDNEVIPFEEGDMVYFTVKKSTSTTKKALQKVVAEFNEDGIAEFELESSDTGSLPVGTYVYDVQYTDRYGKVATIIKPSCFRITKEVTYD